MNVPNPASLSLTKQHQPSEGLLQLHLEAAFWVPTRDLSHHFWRREHPLPLPQQSYVQFPRESPVLLEGSCLQTAMPSCAQKTSKYSVSSASSLKTMVKYGQFMRGSGKVIWKLVSLVVADGYRDNSLNLSKGWCYTQWQLQARPDWCFWDSIEVWISQTPHVGSCTSTMSPFPWFYHHEYVLILKQELRFQQLWGGSWDIVFHLQVNVHSLSKTSSKHRPPMDKCHKNPATFHWQI